MPLTRATVTIASRVMLPTYAILAAYFGALYIIDPQHRLQRTPGLALARMLLPMPAWGGIFLCIAALMCLALFQHKRMWFVTALYGYATAAVIWAGVYLGATFISRQASFGGPAWPLFVAVACVASARSLARSEV